MIHPIASASLKLSFLFILRADLSLVARKRERETGRR
jgi:hypothetical protein